MSEQIKLVMNKQESTQVDIEGNEQKWTNLTFGFDPTVVELVRTKDGAYVIRNRKK